MISDRMVVRPMHVKHTDENGKTRIAEYMVWGEDGPANKMRQLLDECGRVLNDKPDSLMAVQPSTQADYDRQRFWNVRHG